MQRSILAGWFRCAALTASLVAIASPAQAVPAPHIVPAHLAVTGFFSEGDPTRSIGGSAAALTTVGVDGVNISADGTHVGAPDGTARKALAVAHAANLRAEFLVGNFGRSDFAERRAHIMLTTPSDVATISRKLAHSVTTQGWDGVSVDIESLRQRDQHGLVDFLAAIKERLPAGDTVSVNVSNCVTAAEYHHRGYDLAGIATHVDRIILMAYDEHGTWENRPGPVGDLAWQKRGLASMEAAGVPADEIDLGQAGYGYAWEPHRNRMVSDTQARRLVARHGVRASFDKAAGEWNARFPNGSTMWWADARSYRIRDRLARADGLHGLAVWSLGLSDPITLD